MAEFLYDAQVTADDLNNIAVDLGGALTTKFTNNYPYAVDSLNAITGDLVSSGITSYGEKFSVTKDGQNIVIGTGLAIFDGGLKYKLTTPLTMPFAAGDLFIELNAELNTVTMKLGTLPVSGIYNHIATIAENGAITDKKVWAKAKVLLPSEGYSYGEIFNVTTDSTGTAYVTMKASGISNLFIFTKKGGIGSFYRLNISEQKFYGVGAAYQGLAIVNGISGAALLSSNDLYDTGPKVSMSVNSADDNEVVLKLSGDKNCSMVMEIYAFGGETV